MTDSLYAQDDLQFATDFPGGNIIIDRIRDNPDIEFTLNHEKGILVGFVAILQISRQNFRGLKRCWIF